MEVFLFNSRLIKVQSSLPNGINHQNPASADKKMLAFQSISYTSLKDLIPDSPPPMASPTNRKDSWRENIQIKDPLLQHAAWAYLQPMEAERDDDARWLKGLKNKLRGMFGCVNDVFSALLNGWFDEELE